MQTNSLYARSDDMWTSDWLPIAPTGETNDLGLFDSVGREFASSAHYTGYTGDELYQFLDTPQAIEPELLDSSFSYSSAFNDGFVDADGNTPDFDLVASDGVHFAVTASRLRSSSCNNFNGLLAPPSSHATIPLTSSVLNLVLHAVYGLSPAKYAPSVDDLGEAANALERYGLSKKALVARDTPLFQTILMRAPSEPLACYILAAHAELEDLAVLVSPYTLSLPLSDLTDKDVVRIGPHYLKRLFFLHLGRIDALKRILFPPPGLHPPTDECKAEDQRPVSRAWTTEVSEMSWDFTPDVSVSSLGSRLRAAGSEIQCSECLGCLNHRIKQLLVDWSLVKTTI